MEGYLGAQCVPGMCALWKIASGNFYIAKSEKKVYIVFLLKETIEMITFKFKEVR